MCSCSWIFDELAEFIGIFQSSPVLSHPRFQLSGCMPNLRDITIFAVYFVCAITDLVIQWRRFRFHRVIAYFRSDIGLSQQPLYIFLRSALIRNLEIGFDISWFRTLHEEQLIWNRSVPDPSPGWGGYICLDSFIQITRHQYTSWLKHIFTWYYLTL